MTTPQPLTQTSAIKPPPSVHKPVANVVLSMALVVATYVFLPVWLPYVAFSCLSYDLLVIASYLAVLTRWAKAVHTLIEQTSARESRR